MDAEHECTGAQTSWWKRHALAVFLIAALALAAAGIGLRQVATANTDFPVSAEMLQDAREVYLPAGQAVPVGWGALVQSHEPGAFLWKRLWLAVGGQWDARLLALVGLPWQVLALVAIVAVFSRKLRALQLALLVCAVAAMQAAPELQEMRLAAPGAATGPLVVLSLLQLILFGWGRPGWVRVAVGFACGVLNVLSATSGLAAGAALLLWAVAAAVREPDGWRKRSGLLAANAALVVLGLALAVARTGAGGGGPAGDASFLESVQRLAAWPLPHAAWALLVWAPALVCVGQWLWRGAVAQCRDGVVPLFALWAVALVVVLRLVPPGSLASATDVLVCGVLVNAGCLATLPVTGARWRTRRLVLGGLWAIVIVNALLHARLWRAPFVVESERAVPLAAALRQAASGGDTAALIATAKPDATHLRELAALLGERALQRVLPSSVRPPLVASGAGGILCDAAPPLQTPDGLPVFGTWAADGNGAARTGEFVSEWAETPFPLLQMRIAGELRPPATAIVLQTADGTEIKPWSGAFSIGENWRRVILPAPRGPFRVVARDASEETWIAFSAPVEVGWASWVAAKVPREWPWALLAALVLAGAAGTTAGLRAWRARGANTAAVAGADDTAPLWRVLPWLAVVAYAAHFSNHVDSVAGPNDSGGYLNSAKALDRGHITAAPRMVFGPAQGETDVTPYVPITFTGTSRGRLAPQYPVGWPVVIWAVARVMPLEAAVWASVLLHLVAGVVLTRLIARAVGLSEGWAWLAAAIVGLSPVYVFEGLQPLTDGPALVWVTAAVYLALSSRERPGLALAAGVATALAVMIRPSNLLCVAPLLVCFWGRWKQLLLWGLAGLPFALWQAWYNDTLYGAWYQTGYGDVALGAKFVLPTLGSYARWLPALFTPLVWLALAGPFVRRVPRLVRVMLATWAAVFVVFYAFYWCTWDTWFNMRFVLPAAPAFVVLALIVARHALEWVRLRPFADEGGGRARDRVLAIALVLAVAVFLAVGGIERRVIFWAHANREHYVGAAWVRSHLPANAVIVARHATGSLFFYTDHAFVRSDHAKVRHSPDFLARIERSGRPVYALTYHWEARGFNWAGLGDGTPDVPGEWERLVKLWEGRIHVWKWHPPKDGTHRASADFGLPEHR